MGGQWPQAELTLPATPYPAPIPPSQASVTLQLRMLRNKVNKLHLLRIVEINKNIIVHK